MITLWGRKSAFNVQKVMWALKELQVEYDQIEVGGDFGWLDSDEFLEMNPHGRIPVIRHDDKILWESHSIIRYLGATFRNEDLWPQDAFKRSMCDRWMDWSLSFLQPNFMGLFWGYYRMPEEKRNSRRIKATGSICESCFGLLNELLEQQRFLAGDRFTLGDIPAAATLYRYFEMGLEVNRPPQVMAWYERMKQREPYQEGIMIPFDDLFGKEDY